MREELVRRVARLEARLDNLAMPEISPDLAGPLLALPMLRGAWVSSVDSGGDWYDISGHGHTLTYNGNPTFNYAGLAPYWDLDGTGDYFDRADEADLDITGGETYVAAAAQGLTCLGWFYTTAAAAQQGLITKYAAGGGNESYWMQFDTGIIKFAIHDGGAIREVNGPAIAGTTNYFCAGRFDRSGNTVDVWLNETKSSIGVAGGTTIQSGGADLVIGGFSGGVALLTGRASCCALCAAALSDAIISSVFQQQRAAFNV